MFGNRGRLRQKFSPSPPDLHPLDLLISHCTGADTQSNLFRDIAYDWMEVGSFHSQAGSALRSPLSQSEQNAVGQAVTNVFKRISVNGAVKQAGMSGLSLFPLVPNTFRREMSTAVGGAESPTQGQPEQERLSKAREAIVEVTALSVVSLVYAGREQQAVEAAMMGGCLFVRASDWCRAKNTS
jgi:hypothetical protein